MEGKHRRRLLSGMGALATLAAAAADCQSTRFPALTNRADPDSLRYVSSALSPIKLGAPMVRVPAPGATNPTQTVWRPVQRDNRMPDGVVASSSWHPIQRGPAQPGKVVATGMPANGASSAARKEIIPVHLQITQPGGEP